MGSSSRVIRRILRIITNCTSKKSVNNYCIKLSISVKIHRPNKLSSIIVTMQNLIVEIELKPHVRPRLNGIFERFAHFALYTIDNRRHRKLGICCHR